MIEFLGLAYAALSDLTKYLSWKEETKIVDNEWLQKSGFSDFMSEQGYQLRWTNQVKIASRRLDGYEVMCEFDHKNRIRRNLQLGNAADAPILMGKEVGE
jgi:hypothetical protein